MLPQESFHDDPLLLPGIILSLQSSLSPIGATSRDDATQNHGEVPQDKGDKFVCLPLVPTGGAVFGCGVFVGRDFDQESGDRLGNEHLVEGIGNG